MHAGEVGMIEHDARHFRGIARHEVDDARRQTRRLEQLHDVVRAQHRAGRRLPHDRASHQRRRRRQVAADRREVERRDGIDEPFEAAIVRLVPGPVRTDRLLLIELLREREVEAPEVDELRRGIDLRLKHRLRLAEHRRGVECLPPRGRQQLRGPQKHRRPLLPRPARPLTPRGRRRANRLPHFARPRLVPIRQHVPVLVRHHRLPDLLGPNLSPADDERNLNPLAGHLLQASLDLRPLG